MSVKDVLKTLKDEEVAYVDIRFTDIRGKLQHVTVDVDLVDEDFLEEGFMFDGSSIAGWKSIENSDMKLIADTDSAYIDPFYAEKTLCLHCSIVEPDTGESYERDPRGTAQKAEAYLIESGIGDSAFMGPEAEFFIFDDVRFENKINKVSYEVDAVDGSWNTDTQYEMGNSGHRPGLKGGYFPVNPIDDAQDLRSEMLSTMKSLGMKVDKHHHEVASCQHELGLIFGTLTKQADEIQKYKYVIHNVAHAYGKSATFMPKPIYGDNGTGMHVNMSIWKDGKPLFAGDKYADLSQEALYFIGGILKHAKTLNAFTNPSTNSYKRLMALKRLFCVLTLLATALAAFVSRGQKAPKLSVLKPVSLILQQTPTCVSLRSLWLALMASRTRSIQAKRWTRTSMIFQQKSSRASQQSVVRSVKPLTALKQIMISCLQVTFSPKIRSKAISN